MKIRNHLGRRSPCARGAALRATPPMSARVSMARPRPCVKTASLCKPLSFFASSPSLSLVPSTQTTTLRPCARRFASSSLTIRRRCCVLPSTRLARTLCARCLVVSRSRSLLTLFRSASTRGWPELPVALFVARARVCSVDEDDPSPTSQA